MIRNKVLRRSHRHIPEGFLFLLEGKPHPLLIPSIIEEVSSYLPLSDLKSCRQVCKSWNTEAIKKLRKVGKVVIQDDDKLVTFTKFLQPFSKQFINYELRGDLDLGSDSVLKFFKIFGDQIEFVYLNRVRWKDSELRNILFNQLPKLTELAVEARAYSDRRLFIGDNFEVLPNIKILRLNVFSFITELTTPFLRDLIQACPNLHTIASLRTEKRNPLPMQFIIYVVSQMSYDTADDVCNMPFASDIAIAEALCDPTWPPSPGGMLAKLSVLDCNLRLRGQGLQQLTVKNFPLRQLDLTLLADVGTETLHGLLSGLENTLQVLKLKFHPRCMAAHELAIPPLKNLTNLTLNGYRHSLKFLEAVPKLKSLILIRLFFSEALAQENIELKFQSKLECLEVHEDFSQRCNDHTIQSVISLFPLMKRLKLENLTDEALTAVFSGYQQLEALDAMNGLYSDAAVTGIAANAFEDGGCPDDMNPEIEALRRGPSIADLKELGNLSLASPRLSDLSILYGVLQCHNLRNLHLLSSGITDISVERIVEELDLFHFKTEYCYKVSKEVVNYAKKKMRGRKISINEYEGPLKQSEIPKFMRRNGKVSVLIDKVQVIES